MVEDALDTAGSAAQTLLDHTRFDTIDAITAMLGDETPVSEQEFYDMFAALDALYEEEYLYQELNISSPELRQWRESTNAPGVDTRRKTLTDILARAKKALSKADEQILA